MLAREHALSGLVVWLGAAPAFAQDMHHPLGWQQVLLGAVCCTGAAGLPDLDEPGSAPSRSLGPVSQAASHVVRQAAGGHRRATHSLLALGAAAGLGWWSQTYSPLAQAVLVGVLVLLAAQMLGPMILHGHTAAGVVAGVLAGYLVHQHPGVLGPWLTWALVGGMAAHIAGDALTHGGVPLLWPARPRLGLHLMRTGGILERLLGMGMLLAALALLVLDLRALHPSVSALH